MSGGDRVSANIQISNVRQTVLALKAFEPDLLKAMNKQIRLTMTAVRDGARARYPAGQWSLRVNQSKILGQVGASGGSYSAWGWSKSSPGVKAAIFEFLGARYSGSRPQVLAAIATMNARYGSPGRFLWASWDAVGKDILVQIAQIVADTEREMQARLDAAGEGY